MGRSLPHLTGGHSKKKGSWGNTAKGKLPTLAEVTSTPASGSVYAQSGSWTGDPRASDSGSTYAQLPTLQDVTSLPRLTGGRTRYLGDRQQGGRTRYTGGDWGGDPRGSQSEKKHHGFLGAIESVGHDIGKGAHWTNQKLGLAAHDIKTIPAGTVKLAKDEVAAIKETVKHPWVTGEEKRRLLHDYKHPLSAQQARVDKPVAGDVQGQYQAAVEAIKHPLRDPFATLVTVAPMLHGLGKFADVATGGRIVGAKATPRMVKVGGKQVPLHGSEHPVVRAAQKVYDKALQHALDTNPEGRLAGHATRRAAGSIAETARYQRRLHDVTANLLDEAARRVARGKTGLDRRAQQAALELTSVNTSPEEAAAYHLAQAANGVNADLNRKVAALYQHVANQGMLTKDARGNVTVDASAFPSLAHADQQLAIVQRAGDKILQEHGLMSEQGLHSRNNAPARIRAGGKYVDRPANDAAKQAAALEQQGQLSLAPRTDAEQVGTGIVGGDNARQGRGFVSYKTEQPKAQPGSVVARALGPVVGKARSPITSHEFTGAGIEQGRVPTNVTRSAAQHLRLLNRFVNTDTLRRQIAETGSVTRRTSHDVLIRLPDRKAGQLSAQVRQLIGKSESTVDSPEQLQATLDEYRNHLLPDLAAKFSGNKAHAIGTAAPDGFAWVDQRILGPLAEDSVPRGKPAIAADKLNALVTTATVYLKPGHVGTRILTNLATNVIQGSWAHAVGNRKLWDALSVEDRARVLAASGQHGFQAMPHEGRGAIAKVATKGSNWWARYADASFRANSFLYEARKAGFQTPEQIRFLLDKLQNHEGLNAAQAARIDWIAKRANRANIAYDRLSPAERRYFARFVWFYPWLKGSAMFAGHTLTEHPYKAAALGTAGVQGRKNQLATLGDLPSYAQGAIGLGKSKTNPLVTDFSTFSPYATTADLLDLGPTAKGADLLNPVYGAAVQLLARENQYGQHSNKPITDALSTLVSPAPEAQIVTAAVHPTQGMYRHDWQAAFLRALLGPATPRRMNLTKAHKARGLELKGR